MYIKDPETQKEEDEDDDPYRPGTGEDKPPLDLE